MIDRISLSNAVVRLLYVALPLIGIGVVVVLWFPSVAVVNNVEDLWANLGMFFTYPQALHWLPAVRWVSREPVVLPGYILTSTLGLGVLTVSFVLFFGYYLTTLLFFYFALRRLMSKTVAVFSTIFLATNALIIGNFSTTLAEVPATVYTVASLYFVALAITSKKQLHANLAMLASGVAFGFAVNCHLVVLMSAGANYLVYIVYELLRPTGPILKKISRIAIGGILALLGAVTATAILGTIIVVAFHGSFWQILNDFVYVPIVYGNTREHFIMDWPWYGAIAGIALGTCLIAVLNIAVAVRRLGSIEDDTSRRIIAVSVAVLALFAILIAYEYGSGGIFLQFSSYYFCFVPYFALVIFSLLLISVRPFTGLMPYAAGFYLCSIVVVLLRENSAPWLYRHPEQAEAALACALLLALLYGLFAIFSHGGMNARKISLYCLAVLAMAFIVRPDEEVASPIWIYSYREASLQRGLYVRVGDGLRFLQHLNLDPYPKFWVDLRDPKFVVDIGSSQEPSIVPNGYLQFRYQPFPRFDTKVSDAWLAIDPQVRYRAVPLDFVRFVPGDNVVIISSALDAKKEAVQAFRALHLSAVETATHLVAYDGVAYQILVEHVSHE